MRILFISSGNIWGGGSVALFNIVKGLKNKGHQVLVATGDIDGPLLFKLKEIDCPYIQMRMVSSIYPTTKSPYRYVRELIAGLYHGYKTKKRLKGLINGFKPDIVHTNVSLISIAADICYEKKIPHVWHIREYQKIGLGVKYFPADLVFQRKIRRHGNFNIAITKGVFDYYQLRDGIDRVIYDGVFSKELQKHTEENAKKNIVLFAGRVQEAKGTIDAIKAFSFISKSFENYRLEIAGSYDIESSYYKQCCAFLKDNCLEDKVVFLGDRRDIYQLMARSKMLVVPSRCEGFGFITAEAMANKCLVIGRNTGGTKEQFDNGLKLFGTEIAYRFTTIEELIEAMQKAIEVDNSNMIEKAYQTVFSLYCTEQSVDNVESFYKKILECPPV